MRKLLVGIIAGLIAVMTVISSTQPASAGGSWLSPVQHSIEAGDAVTFIGYVGRGQLGWVEDGPFYAFLRSDPETVSAQLTDDSPWPFIHDLDVPLGRLEITDRGSLGYLSLRIAVSFEVPPDLSPGTYPIVYCNQPCTNGIGDLIGADLFIGEEWQGCHEWAFDDPAIVDLPPDAELCGPGGSGTAAEVLAGIVTQSPGGTVSENRPVETTVTTAPTTSTTSAPVTTTLVPEPSSIAPATTAPVDPEVAAPASAASAASWWPLVFGGAITFGAAIVGLALYQRRGTQVPG